MSEDYVDRFLFIGSVFRKECDLGMMVEMSLERWNEPKKRIKNKR